MRDRVGAVDIVVVSSSNEMGAFESGVVAKFFGPLASVVSGGIGCILIVVSVMTLWTIAPRCSMVRRIDRRLKGRKLVGSASGRCRVRGED